MLFAQTLSAHLRRKSLASETTRTHDANLLEVQSATRQGSAQRSPSLHVLTGVCWGQGCQPGGSPHSGHRAMVHCSNLQTLGVRGVAAADLCRPQLLDWASNQSSPGWPKGLDDPDLGASQLSYNNYIHNDTPKEQLVVSRNLVQVGASKATRGNDTGVLHRR